MDVNEIMKMLDWNNDQEIQEEGICMAKQVKCLSLFMQPMDKQRDLNWPGAYIIFERLQSYRDEI